MGILNELVDIGKALHDERLVIGPGGNISAVVGGVLYIKKRGADMSRQDHNDFFNISIDEVDVEHEEISSECPFHLACYKADKKIGAIIHVHSPYMIAASEKARELRDISYEFDCILGSSVPVIDYIQPGSGDLAQKVAEHVKDGKNTILMRKHGAVSTGKDLKQAYLRILALERACITFLHT